MKLKCTLLKTDFVPMVKTPRLWISPETLRAGTMVDVPADIGHQLLAAYPGAFVVVSYDEIPKKRSKQVTAEDLTHGAASEFSIAEG